MRRVLILAQVLSAISICWAQSPKPQARLEAEYYVAAYAQHYRVPVSLVRAIVERESNWQPCTVSPKGAVGLMQLMPVTARRLRVRDRCSVDQNVSGGVRYLAWLIQQFHNDLRLVAAAYYAGEDVIGRRDLGYRNPDVIAYVARIRTTYLRQAGIKPRTTNTSSERDVR
ncbi:MAG: lytic transglycosylase domain-containing protein [Candidatus Sulfotelmatobacter sp.]